VTGWLEGHAHHVELPNVDVVLKLLDEQLGVKLVNWEQM
jgi:hypothetical protein